jgi:retron-type reverse transcriptase
MNLTATSYLRWKQNQLLIAKYIKEIFASIEHTMQRTSTTVHIKPWSLGGGKPPLILNLKYWAAMIEQSDTPGTHGIH